MVFVVGWAEQKQFTKWQLFRGTSLPPIIVSVWRSGCGLRCHEKEDYKVSRDSTWPFLAGTVWGGGGRGSHQDHVGSSSRALAPLGARVSVAPRPLTETEIRGGGRGRGRWWEARGRVGYICCCKGMYSIELSDIELKQGIDWWIRGWRDNVSATILMIDLIVHFV